MRLRRAHPSSERQQGFALLVVLWVVALLSLQVSLFSLTIRDAGALAGSELAIVRGEALASAGIELAAAHLLEPEDGKRWSVDGSTREVRFGGANLAIKITDEAGRLDLNAMDDEILDALLRPYGGSAEAVTQWVDRNGPFLDATQLAQAIGLRTSQLQALLPHLTVYGGDGKINPQVAARETLLLLPGVDAFSVDKALSLRRRDAAQASDVAQALGLVNKWLTDRTGPAYRVEVGVRGEGNPAIGWAEAVILLGKDATAPFRVLSWRYEPTAPQERDER
jgi:general secretion pathway protein K